MSGRLDDEMLSFSDTDLLRRLLLMDGNDPRYSCVLLFHLHPEHYLEGSFTRIIIHGDDGSVSEGIGGPLITRVDRIMDKVQVWANLYPVGSLREAVSNALIHNFYASLELVRIDISQMALNIENNGGIPADWSSEMIFEEHGSSTDNPQLGAMFFFMGMIDGCGNGIGRILEGYAEHSNGVLIEPGHGRFRIMMESLGC